MSFFTEHRMLIGLGLLALGAGLAVAGDPAARDLQEAAAAVNQEARGPEGPSHVVAALAALFDLSPETIESERAATRLGFGEIAIAHAIAEATGGVRTFEQVVAMKRSGLGWGQVVHALRNEDVLAQEHLGEIVSQVRRAGAFAGALRGAAAAPAVGGPAAAKGSDKGATVSAEARAERGEGESHGPPGGPPAGVGIGQGRDAGPGHGVGHDRDGGPGHGGSGQGGGRGGR